jgi:hypothetical protein
MGISGIPVIYYLVYHPHAMQTMSHPRKMTDPDQEIHLLLILKPLVIPTSCFPVCRKVLRTFNVELSVAFDTPL